MYYRQPIDIICNVNGDARKLAFDTSMGKDHPAAAKVFRMQFFSIRATVILPLVYSMEARNGSFKGTFRW